MDDFLKDNVVLQREGRESNLHWWEGSNAVSGATCERQGSCALEGGRSIKKSQERYGLSEIKEWYQTGDSSQHRLEKKKAAKTRRLGP